MQGYSRLSIFMHWTAAILVIALFVTHEGERGSLSYAIHVGGGAIAGILLLWRVVHRMTRGLPSEPDQSRLLNFVSRAVLMGFLAAIFVVTVTGYLLPWSVGQPLDIFGLVAIPSPMSPMRGLHEVMEEAHDLAGHLFIPLLALHLLGVAKHAFIDRDGVLRRMLVPDSAGR